MILIKDGKKYREFEYDKEALLEKEVVENSKLFFGKDTIYIYGKRKINSKSLGGTIPDGFLFDLSDREEPEFYIVEIELKRHNFFDHIFRQITKFFAFFKNRKSQTELIEKIFSIINTDPGLKKEFKKYLGDKEIYKTIKDIIENSQNILLVMDGDIDEIEEIMNTYTDTWGKMVKLLIIKKFVNNSEHIYMLEPEFETIEYAYVETIEKSEKESEVEYTEEFHLNGVKEEVKKSYFTIKEELLKINPRVKFNPRKYYISIALNKNIAFFLFRKKKIRLVVMLPEEQVKSKIRKHKIKSLSESVQRFWNGPSCEIIIENEKNIDEIIKLFEPMIKR